MTGDPVDALSYTDASRELDDIVQFFEGREVDVDQLVGRLERATVLIEELDRRLRQTRMQVEQLVPRLAAVLEPPEPADHEDPAPRGPARGPQTDGGVRWRSGDAAQSEELF